MPSRAEPEDLLGLLAPAPWPALPGSRYMSGIKRIESKSIQGVSQHQLAAMKPADVARVAEL